MIKYTCRKMTKEEIKNISKEDKKNIENFQTVETTVKTITLGSVANIGGSTPKLNIRSGVVDIPTVNKLIPTKCPQSYHKLGDICCPVYLEKGKCPTNDPKDKTRIKGMPICALNYVASNDWAKKNKSKLLHLCSDLPKVTSPSKRVSSKKICPTGLELINEQCYKPCPAGFKSQGSSCIPIEFDRGKGVKTICPPKTMKFKNICYNECPFGFKPFEDYCVPNDLADLV